MRKSLATLLVIAICFFLPTLAPAVTIDWTTVGHPGNANDTVDGDPNTAGVQNFGSVGYSYNIDKYDVTNSQYVEFLNAKDANGANTLGLYRSEMGTSFGGIQFNNGNSSGNKYSAIAGNGNHPVNFISFYDALRFANWLNNGQGSGDTETGAYTLLGGTPRPSNGDSIVRNANAEVFLPSENEWYKAAYYNPATNSYFQYPTSSNTAPTGSGPTALPNHANIQPGGPNNFTNVGAYAGSASPYGAFDMGGNVYQWNESLIPATSSLAPFPDTATRGLRGGYYASGAPEMLSTSQGAGIPSIYALTVGFRVAETPEPSTGALAVIACGTMWWWRKRFK